MSRKPAREHAHTHTPAPRADISQEDGVSVTLCVVLRAPRAANVGHVYCKASPRLFSDLCLKPNATGAGGRVGLYRDCGNLSSLAPHKRNKGSALVNLGQASSRDGSDLFFFFLRDAHDARQETTGEGYEQAPPAPPTGLRGASFPIKRFCRWWDLILRDSRVLFAPESANASKHESELLLIFFYGCVSWQSEIPG